MELTFEQSFQLAAITQTIRGCHNIDQLQDMLIEVTRSNLAQKHYYTELLKKEWGVTK